MGLAILVKYDTVKPQKATNRPNKPNGGDNMGQADKQFGGFLRMLIARLNAVLREKDHDQQMELLREILKDLQTTLED